MKRKFFYLNLSILISAISVNSYGADGIITLTGAVTSASCTINSGSPDMVISLGTVATSSLLAGQYSSAANFSIQLTNCPGTLQTANVLLDGISA